jgi:hypothetical protein
MTTQRRDGRTDVTELVAEELVSVLDFLSRVVQAGDSSNTNYMQDKVNQMGHAVRRLLARLSEFPLPTNINKPVGWDETKAVDGARLRELVTEWGRHYHAARLLYPSVSPERKALEAAGTALAAAGGGLGLSAPATEAVTAWLLSRAAEYAVVSRTSKEG